MEDVEQTCEDLGMKSGLLSIYIYIYSIYIYMFTVYICNIHTPQDASVYMATAIYMEPICESPDRDLFL